MYYSFDYRSEQYRFNFMQCVANSHAKHNFPLGKVKYCCMMGLKEFQKKFTRNPFNAAVKLLETAPLPGKNAKMNHECYFYEISPLIVK